MPRLTSKNPCSIAISLRDALRYATVGVLRSAPDFIVLTVRLYHQLILTPASKSPSFSAANPRSFGRTARHAASSIVLAANTID